VTTQDSPGQRGVPAAPASGFHPPTQAGSAPSRSGPAVPGGKPAQRRPWPALFAVVVSVLALLVAVVSAGLSWRAASKADEALDRIAGLAAPVGQPSEPVTEPTDAPTQPGPTDEPDPNATGAAPELNAQTQYTTHYTDQAMRLPSGCGDYITVDLDEPRVAVDSSAAEIRYIDPCGSTPAYFTLGEGVKGSEVDSESVTPIECADRIRTSPLSSDNQPIRRGQVFCINTSLDTARSSASTWKMVIVSVTAVARDGTVSLTASAWNIPD
jgi:hypothetical protein